MEHVLVYAPPEDQGGRAIGLGASVARRLGARLTLVRVIEQGIGGIHDTSQHGTLELRELIEARERRAIDKLADELRGQGLDVQTKVRWGVAWAEILDIANSEECDLIVKPAHGLTHDGRVFFGSTALNLFRKSRWPVWVVGNDARLPRHAVAAIDPVAPAGRLPVAQRILDLAQRVCSWSEAALHVASAWQAPGSDALKGSLPQADLDEYVSQSRERAQTGIDGILEGCGSPVSPDKVHLLEGDPRDALPRFAEDRRFDLLVVGTLGREGVVGDIIGETAEMIIRQVQCSVLAVPPLRD